MTVEYTTELDGRAEPLLGPELGPPEEAVPASGVASDSHRRSLELKALNGTVFIGITYSAAIILRMVSGLILARFFAPDYYGLLALVTAILTGLYLFSHLGLQDNVIQNPRGGEPSFIHTAWTLDYIRGFGMAFIAALLAWPVSRYYHQPLMFPVMIVLGLGCIIGAHESPGMLLMARQLRVREITLLELFTQFVAFAATLAWAVVSPTIWALVGGRIISYLARLAVTYRFKPFAPPKFAWDDYALKSILHFGKWIFLGTALTFLSSQSDRLILGKLVSLNLLGLYGIAYGLSELPRQVIVQFCSKVGFPFLAKFQDLPRPEFRQHYLKYRQLALAGGAVLLALVVCSGDIFLTHVYPQRYHAAGWMVGILGVGLWHTLLYSTISPAIFALQRSHYNAFAQAVYCATLFVALPWGFHHYGMLGAVVAAAAADLPMYFCFQYAAFREGVNTLVQDVLLTILFIAVLFGTLTLRHSLGFGSPFPSHLM